MYTQKERDTERDLESLSDSFKVKSNLMADLDENKILFRDVSAILEDHVQRFTLRGI